MTIERYWNIIEQVHQASNDDMDRKCKLLEAELRRLPLEEVRSFSDYFDESRDRAYSWELWAAAYIIGGGCSDDSFSDFRSTLISMGRKTFELALADPNSLADLNYDAENAFYEGYQYVPETVSGGRRVPRVKPHPDAPSGEEWDEDKVYERYPKLTEKYS